VKSKEVWRVQHTEDKKTVFAGQGRKASEPETPQGLFYQSYDPLIGRLGVAAGPAADSKAEKTGQRKLLKPVLPNELEGVAGRGGGK